MHNLRNRVAGSGARARDERGQGLVEYALILALVSLAAIVALGFLSGKINGLFSKAGNSLNNVPVAAGAGGSGTSGPPVGGAPLPGSVSLTPTGPVVLNVNFTATNNGWNANGSPITTYNYTWRRTAEGVNCGGAYGAPINTDTSTAPDTTDDLPQLSGDGDNNRCYRVEVTATNGNGTSAPVASNEAAIHQNPADSDVTATVTGSGTDGVALTVNVTTNGIIVTQYDYRWQRKMISNDNTNACGDGNGYSSFGTDVGDSPSSSNSVTTTNGTNTDYCYRVEVDAENEAGDGTDMSNAVFVEGNG